MQNFLLKFGKKFNMDQLSKSDSYKQDSLILSGIISTATIIVLLVSVLPSVGSYILSGLGLISLVYQVLVYVQVKNADTITLFLESKDFKSKQAFFEDVLSLKEKYSDKLPSTYMKSRISGE